MREVLREKTTTTLERVYVADDGTEFENEWECDEYERETGKYALRSVQQCPALEDTPNFDGQEYPEHHVYTWYYVRDEDDAGKIARVFKLDKALYDVNKWIGHWICVEEGECADVWVSSLEQGIAYASKILSNLGYELKVSKKGENV